MEQCAAQPVARMLAVYTGRPDGFRNWRARFEFPTSCNQGQIRSRKLSHLQRFPPTTEYVSYVLGLVRRQNKHQCLFV